MNFTSLTRLLTLAFALLAFAIAGCGESEEDKFANEVNEICTEAEDEIETVKDPDTLVATIDEFISDLKAADPPEDQKDDYEDWVATQEDTFEELKTAIQAKDRAAIDAVDENAGDDQARDLGLDDCTG